MTEFKLNVVNVGDGGLPQHDPVDLEHAFAIELDIGTGVVQMNMKHGKLSIWASEGTLVIEPQSGNAIRLSVNDEARRIRNALGEYTG